MFRLDRTAVVARLRERARDLLDQRPDVVEVRLFGSLARDEAHPGSDADLFVIVHDGAGPLLDRLPPLSKHFTGVGIGCDLIAFTESEARVSKARGDAFARAVFDDGLVLAARESDGGLRRGERHEE